MLNLMCDTRRQRAADIITSIADGVALFYTLDQRTTRRDR